MIIRTTITIDDDLLKEAKARGLNISKVAREGIVRAVGDDKMMRHFDKLEEEELQAESIGGLTWMLNQMEKKGLGDADDMALYHKIERIIEAKRSVSSGKVFAKWTSPKGTLLSNKMAGVL